MSPNTQASVQLVPQLVFVYGTLKNGFHNHTHYLAGNSKYIGACSIPGVLIHLGGIPGLIKDHLCRVTGELYEVDWAMVQRLDSLEGVPDLYNRQQVKTPHGNAWVYYWTRTPHDFNDRSLVVAEGVWRGGKTDKTRYGDLRTFFENRGSPTVSADNTIPAHISPQGTTSLPALPPPKPNNGEPTVGPGVELW